MQKSSSRKATKSSRPDRAPRACVRCRTQKIRCDGFQSQSGSDCSACKQAQIPCQYIDTVTSLDRQRKRYIQKLEARIEQLESLLRRLHPDETFPELGDPIDQPTTNPLAVKTTVYPVDSLAADFDSIQLENELRVYGKFSNPKFTRMILDKRMKNRGMNWEDLKHLIRSRQAPGSQEPNWLEIPGWQRNILSSTRSYRLSFPPEDLMYSLIDQYFAHEHLIRPILHQPTFEAMVQARLHEKDQYFGALVLTVCACGSRWLNDPRTRTKDDMPGSAGWLYYEQVHRLPRPMSEPISLVRLQLFNLMFSFLSGTFLVSLQWSLIGIGLRLALDVGAHLNSTFASAPLAEREQWKRAFWGLFIVDQLMGSALGRAGTVPIDEIDLDLPLEVDDEYWYSQDQSEAFTQPSDKPSKIASFNALIKLSYLLPKVIRITKGHAESSQESETDAFELVAELDSSFNHWLENLPPHLQWKPLDHNIVYFTQATMLHGIFYQCLIVFHRPFIPQSDNTDDPQIDRNTSFAICKNAARTLSRIGHTFSTRLPRDGGEPWMLFSTFHAALILILDYWGGGGTTREDVEQCIESLTVREVQHPIAGALRTSLRGFMLLGDDSWTPSLSCVETGELAAPAATTPASGSSHTSLNTPSFTGPLSGQTVGPNLADLPLSSLLQTGSWSGDSTDQIPTANILASSLPFTNDWETVLLQDWSHQNDTSAWSLWDLLAPAGGVPP